MNLNRKPVDPWPVMGHYDDDPCSEDRDDTPPALLVLFKKWVPLMSTRVRDKVEKAWDKLDQLPDEEREKALRHLEQFLDTILPDEEQK